MSDRQAVLVEDVAAHSRVFLGDREVVLFRSAVGLRYRHDELPRKRVVVADRRRVEFARRGERCIGSIMPVPRSRMNARSEWLIASRDTRSIEVILIRVRD